MTRPLTAIALALALTVAASPVSAASSSHTVTVTFGAPGMAPGVKHGEVVNFPTTAARTRGAPMHPGIAKGLAAKEGTAAHQRALLCAPLPPSLQASCLENGD